MSIRFNPDAETVDDAKEYLLNRAKQLAVEEITFSGFESTQLYFPGVITAHFLCQKSKVSYSAFYILKQYRGNGTYLKVANYINKPIITSPDCHLADFLESKGLRYRLAADFQVWDEYKAISEEYSYIKANRSQIPYMNHVDEGLRILRRIGATKEAQKAFCLHPIYQIDKDFVRNQNKVTTLNTNIMALTIEYRNVANDYLSPGPVPRDIKDIRLSPIKDVNDMLVADKIQNRKDFELHYEKYHNKESLDYYFKAWLNRLGISEENYQSMKKDLS